MKIIIVVVYIIMMSFAFISAVLYYIAYPEQNNDISLKIKLPDNLDCNIKNAITDFNIKVEEEVQNVKLRKL